MNLLASLRTRVFMASVVLAAVTLGFAIYLIGARVSQQAEVELERGLKDAAVLLEEQHSALSQLFLLRARLVADLPVLKAAVDTEDPLTVGSLASDYQRQLRADILVVTDREGHVLFGPADAGELEGRDSVRRALGGLESAAFWPHPSGLLQVVTVPVVLLGRDAPDILGTLSAGFLLDDRRAEEFKRLTASEVAFTLGGQVRAATLPPEARRVLTPGISGNRGVTRIVIADDEYVASGVPLTLPLSPAADEPPPLALVLRSRANELRALRTIQSSLLAAAGLAVALAIVLSYVVARSVTTPLGTITAEMRDMAATGDLTRKIRLRGPPWSQDEDAQLLAATFNTLTDSIARFQREAAQRERLLSLGRLSTVIAHEVRNPLMIIKATLQPLRAASAPPEVRDAAADIDEQVERLNRIVHDVLDFARPLRFELAHTDLAGLCREAAAAATAAGPAPVIRVDAEPITILTDGERLRAALINVLANARQAMTTAPDTAHRHDGVELGAERGPDGRVRITVRDRGPGIPPEHLSQIFDPYFTTRRSGTGLGLPIARNIIEGLGGSVSVRAADPGTIVEIELPEAASAAHEARA